MRLTEETGERGSHGHTTRGGFRPGRPFRAHDARDPGCLRSDARSARTATTERREAGDDRGLDHRRRPRPADR